MATFADDTALLFSHKDPDVSSDNLQFSIFQIKLKMKKWRIKVNEIKSFHINFTRILVR